MSKFIKFLGVALMVLAVSLNPWIIEYFFSPDKKFDFVWKYFVISSIDLVIFLVGFLTYKLSRDKADRVLLFFVSFFVSFAILFLVALSYANFFKHNENYFLPDQKLGWIINPSIKEQSLGFNEESLNFDNLNEDNLVYLIGDSFVYGFDVPYEKAFATIIDEKISSFNFVNLGVPGYNTEQYYLMTEKYISIKKPKIVMVNFFTGNDFWNSEFNVNNVLNTLRKEKLISDINNSSERKHFHEILDDIMETTKYFVERRFSYQNLIFQSESELFFKNYSNEQEKSIEEVFKNLRRINTLVTSNGIDLLFVLHPSVSQIDSEKFKAYLEKSDINPEDLEILKPQKIMKEFFDKEGFSYIDLTPYFLEKSDKQKLYLNKDTHYNIAGNDLAAEVIVAKLKEMNFLGFEDEK